MASSSSSSLTTEQKLDKVIDFLETIYGPNLIEDEKDHEGEEGGEEEPKPKPEPSLGPYKGTGKQKGSTTRGPTTRNYASGKPSDRTIEKNVKEIDYKNYQFITYTTIKGIEHDDNISLKFGGTHMGSGWFDCGVSFKEGQTCLGVEKKHPSTKTCVVKGSKIGSVLNKKIGVAGVYYQEQNKIELWTDTGDGWKKGCEGTNVGGFNPKSKEDEAQLRIDGFGKGDSNIPEISMAIVQEIEAPKA